MFGVGTSSVTLISLCYLALSLYYMGKLEVNLHYSLSSASNSLGCVSKKGYIVEMGTLHQLLLSLVEGTKGDSVDTNVFEVGYQCPYFLFPDDEAYISYQHLLGLSKVEDADYNTDKFALHQLFLDLLLFLFLYWQSTVCDFVCNFFDSSVLPCQRFRNHQFSPPKTKNRCHGKSHRKIH